ncbi:MAG: hypothetical protein IKL97_03720 [Eggerthellaceae bacterium]|nr:hypothetical protein [Eggerthellaceae bacterium]
MHQQVQQAKERRPRPRMRRSNDGLGKAVIGILSRNIPSIVVGLVGCFCVFLPIALGIAGLDYWPFVVAYGGCLVGCALGGVVK